ncbi:gamma carbonic anhydrase family protein [Candidatus Methylospira mobilis]|uniref:Gamma carbonic anhydrase family protein n=1 Tax=Candidatus Methylospira mobilis TaxID=1808979 RepID=A0A5Q0BKU8_9GAMM|nr:gamma carbonic anhydrase family protein [Candidatus Methylospira mobilis]QFY44410.1 gamma carbonic anhydrase family protein [Candidatus Methylospira mobilis]
MTIRSWQGDSPSVGAGVYIDADAVVIGSVQLADDVSIWPAAVVRGDVNSIAIGSGSNIQDGAVLHVTHAHEAAPSGFPLIIGRNVTVGHRAVLHGCTVGDHCLIGIGSIVMDGAVIEEYVMLGAGSLVAPGKRLESGYLYVGLPAKRIRPLGEEEKQFLRYSASHYVALKNECLANWEPGWIYAPQA